MCDYFKNYYVNGDYIKFNNIFTQVIHALVDYITSDVFQNSSYNRGILECIGVPHQKSDVEPPTNEIIPRDLNNLSLNFFLICRCCLLSPNFEAQFLFISSSFSVSVYHVGCLMISILFLISSIYAYDA